MASRRAAVAALQATLTRRNALMGTTPVAANMNPLSPGIHTSEGALTIAAVLLGTVLEGVGTILSHEQLTHAGSVGWSIASVVAGALLQLCTVYGYTKGRSLIKQQAILTGITSALPLAVQIAEAVADKLSVTNTPVAISYGSASSSLRPPVVPK